MQFRHLSILFLAFGIFGLWADMAFAQMPVYREGEVLVQYKPDTGVSAMRRAASQLGATTIHSFKSGHLRQLALPGDVSVEEALEKFRNDPDVAFAEPNYLLFAQVLPSDVYFNKQWGLYNTGQSVSGKQGQAGTDIDAVRAWEIAEGMVQSTVAVIDTGCNFLHPDLSANIWVNDAEVPGNGQDDDHNGYVDDVHGWDFADNDNIPQDATGHGTHVAGIIAAENDNYMGISGVAQWQSNIMAVRFMTAFDSGTVADAIKAIDYAVDNGATIINCSWGSSGYSSSLYRTIEAADALFVCAAGNDGMNNDNYGFYPASYALDNVISVAAGDQNDELAWFSNYGIGRVHVVAPGTSVYSLGFEREIVWADDFSDGNISDWTTEGEPVLWQVTQLTQSYSSHVLGLDIESEYPDNTNAWIISPALDLSAVAGCRLSFSITGSSELNRDLLYVEVSTDSSLWRNCPVKMGGKVFNAGISGDFGYWTTSYVDLGHYDGSARLYVRFRFRSNQDTTAQGFQINNVVVSAASPEETYRYMSGTSMAAPFVSGAAAVLRSQDESLVPWQIKQFLIDSVDTAEGYADNIVSGGRINLYNALMLLSDPEYEVERRIEMGRRPSSSDDDSGCFIGHLRF